jgi:hypothetical protein
MGNKMYRIRLFIFFFLLSYIPVCLYFHVLWFLLLALVLTVMAIVSPVKYTVLLALIDNDRYEAWKGSLPEAGSSLVARALVMMGLNSFVRGFSVPA